jgi:hypothetical protein
MANSFYSSLAYKKKQSTLTRKNWEKRRFDFLHKRQERECFREGCRSTFVVIPSNPKKYCGNSCAAIENNSKRGERSKQTKAKIANSLKGRKSPYLGVRKVPLEKLSCKNLHCKNVFFADRWMKRKFCGKSCAIDTIGKQPTSPKAARAKAGIRKDISATIYFYSRWEANIARLFNLLSIQWQHQPKTFDLGSQTYTPDFYLPETDEYIEVKNFMGEYSKLRDKKFRKLYPDLKLRLIMKKDYLKLQEKYSRDTKKWEYNNSEF